MRQLVQLSFDSDSHYPRLVWRETLDSEEECHELYICYDEGLAWHYTGNRFERCKCTRCLEDPQAAVVLKVRRDDDQSGLAHVLRIGDPGSLTSEEGNQVAVAAAADLNAWMLEMTL